MDAVTPCGKLVERAHEWGHPAIAITDHGIAQAFPDAMNAWRGFKDKNFKVIFGCEAYVVNDLNRLLVVDNPEDRTLQDEIIVFDVETTGLSPANDRLTEIGAVRMRGMQVVETFNTMVNPERPIPAKIVELTGITDSMVEDAPKEAEAMRKFIEFCGENPVLAAHNANFDTSFVRNVCKRNHITFEFATLDTLVLCKSMLPTMARHKLDGVAKALKLGKFDHHRASDDAQMLAKIYKELVGRLMQTKGATMLSDLNTKTQEIDVKKLKSFHQIILVRNNIGLKNLYKLISYGHIECFYRKPLIPKSVLMQYREGLIFGSACEAGELFQAFVEEKPHEEIVKLAKFYDYLEIQPAGNNAFMIRNGTAANMEQLQEYNRKIVALVMNWEFRFVQPVTCTSWTKKMPFTARSCKPDKAMTMQNFSRHCICVPRKKCWKNSPILVKKRHTKLLLPTPMPLQIKLNTFSRSRTVPLRRPLTVPRKIWCESPILRQRKSMVTHCRNW